MVEPVIEKIDQSSPLLMAVKELWRPNSATLGYFPDGAFEEYASKGNILVAGSENEPCAGYLLYRISKGRAAIVHLCVKKEWQQKGIAKALVADLRNRTKHLQGISLKCRRDFDVSPLWPRLGFVAMADLAGRSRDGKKLTYWWCDHNHPNIFTRQIELESKLSVVIDANIFFDIEQGDDESHESLSLQVDWLQSDIELYVTPELYNEINRDNDPENRKYMQVLLERYTKVQGDIDKVEEISKELSLQLAWKPTDDNGWSDLRHLSWAIAAGMQFFITRDGKILNKADELYNQFNLTVMRPSDLIIHSDELFRESEYQPVRLGGSSIISRQPNAGEQDNLARRFLTKNLSEPHSEFLREIRKCISAPRVHSFEVIVNDNEDYMGMVVCHKPVESELIISLIRLANHHLSETVIRHVIQQTILRAAQENRNIVKVIDKYLDFRIQKALEEERFVKIDNVWTRITSQIIDNSQSVIEQLQKIQCASKQNTYVNKFIETLNRKNVLDDPIWSSYLESLIWPAKLTDANIPTYIIPIRPGWAKDLFDKDLALATLFGADAKLALNTEAVYYRSAHQRNISFPGRILWYVTHSRDYDGSGSIRAISKLDEVIVGKPKEIFKQFRRLGVYQWDNVFNIADRKENRQVMALRFSQTHRLESHITNKKAKEILKESGYPTQFQSPHRIPPHVFAQLINNKE